MFSISDLNELEIYITDGWREWYIPKFRLTMVVDEPFLTLYWTDTEKGSEGITRVLEMDYQDMLFGYSIPASASNAEILIQRFETSAWDELIATVTDDGNGIIEIDNTNPQNPVLRFTGKVPYVLGMSSGVIEGGALSINANPAKFDIAAGNGIIVDDYTDPQNPVIYEVSWATMTAVTVTNIGTATYTHVFLDNAGAVYQTNTELTGDERRDYIYLGHIGHTNLTSIGAIVSNPDNFTSPVNQIRDLEEALGTINLGVRVTANGANLNLDNSAGRIYLNGSNFHTDNKNPSFSPVSAGTNISWRYRTQTGAGATASAIDPASYDNAGTITAIAGTKSTIQYIFVGVNGNFVIQYGQTLYNSLEDAELAALSGTDPFVVFENLDEVFVLTALLCIQSNATDLTVTNRAKFINASKFGEVGVGGAGSSGASSDYWINVTTNSGAITSGATRYFGSVIRVVTATAGESKIYFREAGTIVLADLVFFASTIVGSNENISIYVRLNNTTDYLVATVGTAVAERIFTNTAMNVPIANGDYIEMKIVTPSWGTQPTGVLITGHLIFVGS